jgi:hypothetical protein
LQSLRIVELDVERASGSIRDLEAHPRELDEPGGEAGADPVREEESLSPIVAVQTANSRSGET